MTTLDLATALAPVTLTVAALVLLLGGIAAARLGWKAHTEPIPHFVAQYRGFSCPLLSLFYGGLSILCLIIFPVHLILPDWVGGIIGLIYLPSLVIFFLGYLIWFPRFLLPRWYRRAVKAGVPRHDPFAMGAFKALPISEQRQLVNLTTRAEHQPPPIPTTPPTTQIPITNATKATTSLPTLPGLSAGITAGLNKERP